MKNGLEKRDCFGATELRVLHRPSDMIELQDFGLGEQDVEFIYEEKKAVKAMNLILASKIVGIDCESFGGRNTFDPLILSIAQIAISGNKADRIFIFDMLCLPSSKQFRKAIK